MQSKKIVISVIVTSFNRKKMVSRCLRSIFASTFPVKEIIVVDNASTDGSADFLSKKFESKIKIIRSSKNLLAGGGRNLGSKNAKGELLLFIDSDNVIDKNMVKNLVKTSIAYPCAGLIGPIMHYYSHKEIIWWAGSDINLWTSKTTYQGIGQKNKDKYYGTFEVGHIPNVFMISKKIFLESRGFDTNGFPMHYEESDLAERIKNLGYSALCNTEAISYHDTPMTQKSESGAGLALNDSKRAYYNFRNRIVFMKKYGKSYPLFVLLFLPFFTTVYLLLLFRIKRQDLIKYFLLGIKDGLIYKK